MIISLQSPWYNLYETFFKHLDLNEKTAVDDE